MTCIHKVMHEHSWVEAAIGYGHHATEVFLCKICGTAHTVEDPKVEFKLPFAYFHAARVGADLSRIFAISGG